MRLYWDLCGRCSTTLAVIAVGSIIVSPIASASDSEDVVEKVQEQSEAASKILGERRFFVIPIPIANPTVGTGLGVSAMYLLGAN